MKLTSQQKILIVFLIFLLARVFFLNSYVWYDEAGWGADLNDFNSLSHTPSNIPHMQLSLVFFKASTLIFGYTNFALRIVPLIFGIGLFFLIYLLAKKIYNEETALAACFLFSISFWSVIANTIVDMDGAILSFFVLLTVYFFVKAEKSKLFLFLTGLGLTVCTLTREITGLFVLGIFFVYFAIKSFMEKKIKQYATKFLIILGSFVLTAVPILYFLYLQNPAFYGEIYRIPIDLVMQALNGKFSNSSLANLLLSFSVFLWATPLLIYHLLARKFEKKELLFYLMILISFVVFSISLKGGDPTRYTSIVIPYLVILMGSWLTKVRKQIIHKLFWALSSVFLIAFLVYNYLIPFNPPNNYVDFLNHISENFLTSLFVYGGSSVNPFYISSLIIVVVFLTSFVLFLLKSRYSKQAITIFLAINIAFNLFLITEYTFALTKPDIKSVGNEMMEKIAPYVNSNPGLAIDYANYEAMELYFNYKEKDMNILVPFNLFFTVYNPSNVSKQIAPQIKGRYFFYIDYLKNPKNEVTALFDNCTLLETASYHNEVLGYFYKC